MTKSIAIIGEGETEWFYFDSLRVACRYPFKVAPDFPFRQVEYKNSISQDVREPTSHKSYTLSKTLLIFCRHCIKKLVKIIYYTKKSVTLLLMIIVIVICNSVYFNIIKLLQFSQSQIYNSSNSILYSSTNINEIIQL